MQLLTVYTREDYIFENNLILSLIQDRVSENMCYLECKRKEKYLFGNIFQNSIYNTNGVLAVADVHFNSYGIKPKMLYSLKRFTYTLQPANPFHTIEFTVSGDERLCLVSYSVNNPAHIKSAYFYCNFDNLLMVRWNIDLLFQMIYSSRCMDEKKFEK